MGGDRLVKRFFLRDMRLQQALPDDGQNEKSSAARGACFDLGRQKSEDSSDRLLVNAENSRTFFYPVKTEA